ncbi:helix-turn-helix domain-containing protein [Catellatospora vulcania]|uniref:helix-turn-helix domain-containing protein n=1 Tax=Catellatospora vulcania TaxID=1460450 RepID=UPI0012D3792E|nr:helix-turn-helix domain-containing protein [Catellatospora vulcania]
MAKAELRAQAVALREAGSTVPEIAARLGVARSTAFTWVRHVPLPDTDERVARRREHSKRMTDAQWSAHRRQRDERHLEVVDTTAVQVGRLTERELLLVGAVLYWSEGAKHKPWRPTDWQVTFTNSDLVLVELFLRFVESTGRSRHDLRYRLSIHESAEVAVVQAWWAQQLHLTESAVGSVTLKRHTPSTGRHNQGVEYRGCLVVTVPRGRELYWLIEGVMNGLARSGRPAAAG